MELLCEKNIIDNNGEIKDILLERKISFLQKQIESIRSNCWVLFECHWRKIEKDNYKPESRWKSKSNRIPELVLKEMKAEWAEIQQQEWKEHAQYLNIFKAVSGYFPGCICVLWRKFDEALKYLTAAADLIERESLQYIIPEYYVSIIIEMSKCYIEKHTPSKTILNWLEKGEKILEKESAPNIKKMICHKYGKFYYDKLLLELKLQHVFIDMNEFSMNESYSLGDILRSGSEEEGGNKKHGYALLKEAEDLYKGTERNLDIKISDKKNGWYYYTWKKELNTTFFTTKGEFFKDLYFKVKDIISLLKKVDIENQNINFPDKYIEGIKFIIEKLTESDNLDKADDIVVFLENPELQKQIQELAAVQNKMTCNNKNSGKINNRDKILKLQEYCIKAAFDFLSKAIKENNNNTISWNAIAALLYDYRQEDEDKDRDEIWETLLNEYFKEKGLDKCFIKKEDRLKFTNPELDKIIEAILNNVLAIEHTNMFALNIKAVLKPEEGKKSGEISEKINTYNTYPALRRSSLKRRFIKMKELCGNKKSSNEDFWNAFQNMEISLIILYIKVIHFMNGAIIDWEDSKGLKVGHYTRMSVLPKLININPDSRLRIQNVHYMNDPLEGALLIERLKSLFKNKDKQDSSQNKDKEDTSENKGDKNSLLNELWNLYDFDKRGTVRNSVYTGSFTSRLDQLNMWERYGENGKGISIQLNPEEYFDKAADISLSQMSTSDGTEEDKIENIKYPLYMVIYLSDWKNVDLNVIQNYAMERKQAMQNVVSSLNSSISAREDPEKEKERWKSNVDLEEKWWKKQEELVENLNKLVTELIGILNDIQSKYNSLVSMIEEQQREPLKREVCNTIMIILDQIRFLIKSDVYRDEREYRIIQYSSDPECETEGTEVPKLYVPIEKELTYEKVCFGPLVKDFESKAAYVLNIKKKSSTGENKSIEVCKSSIHYRKE